MGLLSAQAQPVVEITPPTRYREKSVRENYAATPIYTDDQSLPFLFFVGYQLTN